MSLFSLIEPNRGGLCEREDDYLFAGDGADVVVKTDDFDAGDTFDHTFEEGACGFDELSPDLFQEIAALVGRHRLDQLLLGGGENAPEPHDEQIADDVGADVFGTSPHVFLLETAHSVTNGSLDLTLRFHRRLDCSTREFRNRTFAMEHEPCRTEFFFCPR
jgi:hypothetical protein